MARASQDVLLQEAEIINAWRPTLEYRNCKDAANVEEDIEVEDEQLELDC